MRDFFVYLGLLSTAVLGIACVFWPKVGKVGSGLKDCNFIKYLAVFQAFFCASLTPFSVLFLCFFCAPVKTERCGWSRGSGTPFCAFVTGTTSSGTCESRLPRLSLTRNLGRDHHGYAQEKKMNFTMGRLRYIPWGLRAGLIFRTCPGPILQLQPGAITAAPETR